MTADTAATPIEPSDSYNNAVTRVSIIRGAFTPSECDRAIALADFAEEQTGAIGTDRLVSSMRRSQTRFLPPAPDTVWIYQKLESFLVKLNADYQFDLTGMEAVQIARYSEGCYYDWHMDLGQNANSMRKLSLSVQLSDRDDYDDGELEFMNIRTEDIRERGTLIAFPAFMMHRVNPVRRGTRLSLVVWVNGAPFA